MLGRKTLVREIENTSKTEAKIGLGVEQCRYRKYDRYMGDKAANFYKSDLHVSKQDKQEWEKTSRTLARTQPQESQGGRAKEIKKAGRQRAEEEE